MKSLAELGLVEVPGRVWVGIEAVEQRPEEVALATHNMEPACDLHGRSCKSRGFHRVRTARGRRGGATRPLRRTGRPPSLRPSLPPIWLGKGWLRGWFRCTLNLQVYHFSLHPMVCKRKAGV